MIYLKMDSKRKQIAGKVSQTNGSFVTNYFQLTDAKPGGKFTSSEYAPAVWKLGVVFRRFPSDFGMDYAD